MLFVSSLHPACISETFPFIKLALLSSWLRMPFAFYQESNIGESLKFMCRTGAGLRVVVRLKCDSIFKGFTLAPGSIR